MHSFQFLETKNWHSISITKGWLEKKENQSKDMNYLPLKRLLCSVAHNSRGMVFKNIRPATTQCISIEKKNFLPSRDTHWVEIILEGAFSV